MIATYSIRKNELDSNFIKSIKKTFKSERISILIEEETDESERIMQNKPLYEKLLKSSDKFTEAHKVIFEGNEFMEKFGSA